MDRIIISQKNLSFYMYVHRLFGDCAGRSGSFVILISQPSGFPTAKSTDALSDTVEEISDYCQYPYQSGRSAGSAEGTGKLSKAAAGEF